jgi:hypothetical protein
MPKPPAREMAQASAGPACGDIGAPMIGKRSCHSSVRNDFLRAFLASEPYLALTGVVAHSFG